MRLRWWLAGGVTGAVVAMGGCGMGGAGVGMNEGRLVNVRSDAPWVQLRGGGETTEVRINGRRWGMVTAGEIVYGEGERLALPAGWRVMELKESWGRVRVEVDGKVVGVI